MKSKGTRIAAVLAAVTVAALWALPRFLDMDRFRPQLESSLASSLGREVHVGHMEFSLLAGGARVEQISVADDPTFRQGEFIEAKSLDLGVRLLPLIFSRSLHVTSLTLDEPQISAIKSASGKWNFATLGHPQIAAEDSPSRSTDSAASLMTSIVFDHLKISNATLLVTPAPAASQTTLRNINVDLKNIALDKAMTLTISATTTAGKIEVDGGAGPLAPDSSNQLPFHATVRMGRSSADVSGSCDLLAQNPALHAKISGNQLPLDSVKDILPLLGVTLPAGSKLQGGTITANLSLEGPVDRLVTSGKAQIANAHLAGFDLASKLGSLPGMSGTKGNSSLSIVKLGANLHIAPSTTHISAFDGEFAGIGSITGDGDISGNNHLQFKMIAHIPSGGVIRLGLTHVGLRNLPNELPFQVVGTTAAPLIIPDLNGIAANPAKSAVASVAKKSTKGTAQVKTASNKKGGFFHRLFGHGR